MACNFFDIDLEVYMVKVSYNQKPYRRIFMETYGAQVFASHAPPVAPDLSLFGREGLAGTRRVGPDRELPVLVARAKICPHTAGEVPLALDGVVPPDGSDDAPGVEPTLKSDDAVRCCVQLFCPSEVRALIFL